MYKAHLPFPVLQERQRLQTILNLCSELKKNQGDSVTTDLQKINKELEKLQVSDDESAFSDAPSSMHRSSCYPQESQHRGRGHAEGPTPCGMAPSPQPPETPMVSTGLLRENRSLPVPRGSKSPNVSVVNYKIVRIVSAQALVLGRFLGRLHTPGLGNGTRE